MSKSVYVLGLSFFYHDAAACLLRDGIIVAAAAEERFTRKKHDESFPRNAIKYCLEVAGIVSSDIDFVGFYEKPLMKFDRILETEIRSWPLGFFSFIKAMPIWLREKLWIPSIIKKEIKYDREVFFIEHHLSHASSSFLISSYEEAAIMTFDGVGEWATSTLGRGRDGSVEIIKEINYPDSLGLFYSTITYFLGFKPNDAEYKVMGLSPYGRPVYYEKLKTLIEIKNDGSFKLNPLYFRHNLGLKFDSKKFEKLLGFSKRESESELQQCHKDLAASLQKITEEIIIKAANYLHILTGSKNLCMAGGVALNCVANTKVLQKTPFENIFIQPAAGDDGGAMGVAFYIWNCVLGNPRKFVLEHCYWGPEFSNEYIAKFLNDKGAEYQKIDSDNIVKRAAQLIANQKVLGWFQGRMEWGPRALGNRSILADARNKENWQKVNLKIKFRESFRPFAPSVLEEDSTKFFDHPGINPFMLFINKVKGDSIPAVTHIDRTARIQTISRRQNPLYYSLISEFKKLTGVPVIINTSFNVRSEPIVCSPEDAFNDFIKTKMDYLILGNYLLNKRDMRKFYDDDGWKFQVQD